MNIGRRMPHTGRPRYVIRCRASSTARRVDSMCVRRSLSQIRAASLLGSGGLTVTFLYVGYLARCAQSGPFQVIKMPGRRGALLAFELEEATLGIHDVERIADDRRIAQRWRALVGRARPDRR